ncbi:MAG: DUF4091 domain-containing protein [Granulosicoccus sp.]|nr:DUF4091 domain-containing protein [Granulosicoccus sp.]
MARITRTGSSSLEHPRYDLNDENPHRLHWQVAKNEYIAFQLIIRRTNRHAPKFFSVQSSESQLPINLFQSHYIRVDNAGYTWGPQTTVLPYPDLYPDALIPARHGCLDRSKILFDNIDLPRPGANQSVWIEIYIPDNTTTGVHNATIEIKLDSTTLQLPIMFDVINARLPHEPSIDAVAELYRTYQLEGVGTQRSSPQWQDMAQCYQQLAHQHRMVFMERFPNAPQSKADWQSYRQAFGPALTGELFTADFGYSGTGYGTPVGVWRTPWPQQYDIEITETLDESAIVQWTTLAKSWQAQIDKNGWDIPHQFAYVFDEVDGPSHQSEQDPDRRAYITRAHENMRKVQTAIDQGADGIDLLWTSHSDPSIWQTDDQTTLEGTIRLWSPNAHAANVEFLSNRMAMGERAWFYHSGHPAVGGHSINLPGSDMRSWGVIGARYSFNGQLMWAANLGSDRWPFSQPSYKPDDDRVGNGVLVYPGNQLEKIGFPTAPGPLPSMRLKTWRRGLQDAELFFLAMKRDPEKSQALIRELIPLALGEAVAAGAAEPTWSDDARAWIEWRDELLTILAGS